LILFLIVLKYSTTNVEFNLKVPLEEPEHRQHVTFQQQACMSNK